MAKWVYIRGFPTAPYDTRFYTGCANAFLTNVQTLCGLTVTDIDIDFRPNVGFITITYDATTPIAYDAVFPF